MCCINETLACGMLEGQLSVATSPLTRAALQTVLADEIDHARAGWAHLATPFVTDSMRKEISAGWLPRLLNAKLREFLDDDSPFRGDQYPQLGILTRAVRSDLIKTSLVDVIFPGFDRAGIDSTKAREWTKTAFPSRDRPAPEREVSA
jgi:hypothetical protein